MFSGNRLNVLKLNLFCRSQGTKGFPGLAGADGAPGARGGPGPRGAQGDRGPVGPEVKTLFPPDALLM